MHRRWTGVATIVLGLVTLAAPAAAQDGAGPDEISLKSGGIVRGTVVELDPGRTGPCCCAACGGV